MEIDTADQEKIFFQESNVKVTQSRFIAGSKTYAMSNISSVAPYHIRKSRLWPVVLILIGLVVGFTGEDTLPVGIVMTILGVLWFISIKDEFSVRIQSNSGETDGLRSKNKEYVQTIVDAINNAIVYRG